MLVTLAMPSALVSYRKKSYSRSSVYVKKLGIVLQNPLDVLDRMRLSQLMSSVTQRR